MSDKKSPMYGYEVRDSRRTVFWSRYQYVADNHCERLFCQWVEDTRGLHRPLVNVRRRCPFWVHRVEIHGPQPLR